jgi:hypothetical protein
VIVVAILALVLAVVGLVVTWSVAAGLHRLEVAAVKACLLLHDRLHDVEGALATTPATMQWSKRPWSAPRSPAPRATDP